MKAHRLTGPEQGELADLLVEAFTRARFEQMLSRRLNRNIERLVSPADDLDTVLYKVIDDATRQGWWVDLVTAARAARPTDAGLQAFGSRFGLGPVIVTPDGAVTDERRLLAYVRKGRTGYDMVEWRARLGEIEGRVCRIEFPHGRGRVRATGFLVGPSVVLTNHHVVEPIIDEKVPPSAVTILFDPAYREDGTSLPTGTRYRLAADWCIGFSPSSLMDRKLKPDREPHDGELDFALLRADGRPGDEPVGGSTADRPAPPRGWFPMPAEDHDFTSSPELHIVQHPGGRQMVVMVDNEAVIEVNPPGTRVRYRTNTEPGSSGSPCFGPDWQWVAVHQSGDPAFPATGVAGYNQGIPVSALRRATERWRAEIEA
ncbi:trypsin-like peptidase domain-containing protein [Micromonospora chersina]|uniref:trypsin-like peptidase domain-containing protein n=1 Tax=Micromonospora chersina TaxID=47854 RepID=UPI00371E5592